MSLLARIVAMCVHEVVTEYRRLDDPGSAIEPPMSLPSADALAATPFDEHEVQADAFGFGPTRKTR
jgi:hypothetical protein